MKSRNSRSCGLESAEKGGTSENGELESEWHNQVIDRESQRDREKGR